MEIVIELELISPINHSIWTCSTCDVYS